MRELFQKSVAIWGHCFLYLVYSFNVATKLINPFSQVKFIFYIYILYLANFIGSWC